MSLFVVTFFPIFVVNFHNMQIASNFKKQERYIYKWLLTGCVLIVLMVVVGGITRLTQSGLSMVKWEPIMGTLPPMSQQAWQEAFDLYKQSPEFYHYNADFTLSDFKSIFFWEYLHRLIARILGMVFIIPFVIFWFKGFFSKRVMKHVLIIFALGTFQGVLGWFMVKSGLVDQPHVSHYRLAAHLFTALGLLVYIYWVALSIKYVVNSHSSDKLRRAVKVFIGLVFLQIIYGAFVAGLKAGFFYNTFPKMGTNWIPDNFGSIISSQGVTAVFDNPGIVQFIHRIIAYAVLFALTTLWMKAKKEELSLHQRKGLVLLSIMVGIQVVLGILTLLYVVPISLGVAHQFGAILVLLASFYSLFTFKKDRNGHL